MPRNVKKAAAAAPRPAILGNDLTIAAAAACRAQLAAALAAQAGDLTLDLSGVSEFDSSGLQLLLAARRSLAARGAALRIVAASATVRAALAVLGLEALLEADAALAPQGA